ncbi:MAG: hypothetical protein ACRDOF_00095 [Gaiellaceae bacterium]
MRGVRAFTRRIVRSVTRLARDGRVPRPLRWAVVFGLLPIPGPVDELVLLMVAAALWLFWRDLLVEAWRQTHPDNARS